jgi:zinc protease
LILAACARDHEDAFYSAPVTRRSLSFLSFLVAGATLVGCTSSSSKVNGGGSKAVDDTTAEPETTDSEPTQDTTSSTEPAAPTKDLSEFDKDYPVDADVLIGKLDNGLTYYIRENNNPGAKVELRLVINAGSAQESPGQAAGAHFLEHMLFNGTTKYPKNELVETLQSFGSEFGADVNAYTSADETVYKLSMPSENTEAVTTGFDVLHEWLTAATIDADLVVGERGVVLDEWRQSENSFGGRLGVKLNALLFDGTPYEDTDPIGTDTAIEAMTPELLRSFYDDWYRPDNAAIVVVGDINTEVMEAIITTTFGDASGRGANPPKVEIELAPYATPKVATLIDDETSEASVEVTLARPATTDRRIIADRADLTTSLGLDIIATRLSDDQKLTETPYSEASVDSNNRVRGIDAPSLLATANPGGAAETLDLIAVEMERVARFGVTEAELERAIAPYEAAIRDLYEGRDSKQDVDFADEYVDNFLTDAPIPDADSANEIYTSILASIDTNDVTAAFTELMAAAAPQVMLVAPTNDEASLPSEATVFETWKSLSTRDITPREEAGPIDTVLMATPPDAVQETSSEAVAGDPGWYTDPTLLTFPNGARVYLNPTPIVEGNVSFQAISAGGLSLVADADVANAQVMGQVASASGLGDLNAVELSQVLAGASVTVDPFLDSTSENLYGSSSTDDLETMLQVTHLLITDPQFDKIAINDTTTELTPYIEDPTLDPEFGAQIALTSARYGTEQRMQLLPTAAEMATFDPAIMDRVWDERFDNASDWVFVLVGDFDLDEASQLVRQYIGSLPSTGATEVAVDVEIDPPTTIVRSDVVSGSGDKASLTVQFNGPTEGGRREQALADLTAEIISNRLTENVREALGASYSPYAQTSLYTNPDLLIETTISVTGSASQIEQLSTVVQENLNALRTEGTGGAEWDAALEAMIQRYNFINNEVIAENLLRLATEPGFNLRDQLNLYEEFEEITTDDINAFFQRVLPADRYIEVRLTPA